MLVREVGDLGRFGWIFRIVFSIFCACGCLEGGEINEAVRPHLLPASHSIKPFLDALFSTTRATFSLESLEEAGFRFSAPRKFTHLIVARHPALPGYILKLYVDVQRYHKDLPEWDFWVKRVEGAERLREEIKKRAVEVFFKVPHKWIYVLPEEPKPVAGYYPKQTILVEEDMDILGDKENKELWASSYVSFWLLETLFQLLKEVGLYDGAKPDNIPFSHDGRMAFVDTQTFGHSAVRYKKLLPYLSKENQGYWKSLIEDR